MSLHSRATQPSWHIHLRTYCGRNSIGFNINYLCKLTMRIKENKTIMASKYQLYLPTEKQLLTELKREINGLKEKSQINVDKDSKVNKN